MKETRLERLKRRRTELERDLDRMQDNNDFTLQWVDDVRDTMAMLDNLDGLIAALEQDENDIQYCRHGRIQNEFHTCFDCENE